MKLPYLFLFEFMDQRWLPSSLRNTCRDILEGVNSFPFRSYYKKIMDLVLKSVKGTGISSIVELGAGTAPVTRRLAKRVEGKGISLVPTDIHPQRDIFKKLQKRYRGRIEPRMEPVDFSKEMEFSPLSLFVLSASFHHIPKENRSFLLNKLVKQGHSVLIAETLRRNMASIILVLLSPLAALFIPLLMIHRPGTFLRIFWTWVFPLAPLLLVWDGVVSCFRQWDEKEWNDSLALLKNIEVKESKVYFGYSIRLLSSGKKRIKETRIKQAKPQIMNQDVSSVFSDLS